MNYRIWARLALWAAAVGATTMALVPHPPHVFLDRFGDKVEHMCAFATLALLAAIAHPETPRLRLLERLSFLGALIEVFQSIPALHRDCDVHDWIADTLSVAIVLAVCRLVERAYRQRRRVNGAT
jgi:VanZ family protein